MAKSRTSDSAETSKVLSTEQQIINAAREVFQKKGFSATRTRDIASAAGINLALLNYYFRSKKKLFDIIMMESLKGMLGTLEGVLNQPETSLFEKIENLVVNYINFLQKNSDIPLFILSELRSNPQNFANNIGFKKVYTNSLFLKQIQESVKKGEIISIHPLQLMMNLIGMTIFPFAGSTLFQAIGNLSDKAYSELMEERKKIIPQWMFAALKPSTQIKRRKKS